MDTTTGIIVFIFVVSILTSLGGNRSNQQPVFPQETTSEVFSTVSVAAPGPCFIDASGEAVGSEIKRFIMKYRSEDLATSITESLMRYSQKYDVNPKLVAALMARESKFNPRAISSSGAVGLGQLLPSTAKGLKIDNAYDVDQNTLGTVRYVKSLIERFNGRTDSAVAAYLEGPNAVDRQGGYSAHTKSYVEDIFTLYQQI